MLLSAMSILVVAQSSSEIPEGLMNNPVQNETYIKMRSFTTRKLKKSATFKQEDLISSKSGQHRVNLILRIEFVSSVSYKFLPNTQLQFLID